MLSSEAVSPMQLSFLEYFVLSCWMENVKSSVCHYELWSWQNMSEMIFHSLCPSSSLFLSCSLTLPLVSLINDVRSTDWQGRASLWGTGGEAIAEGVEHAVTQQGSEIRPGSQVCSVAHAGDGWTAPSIAQNWDTSVYSCWQFSLSGH